jgi:hypothetical protein
MFHAFWVDASRISNVSHFSELIINSMLFGYSYTKTELVPGAGANSMFFRQLHVSE